MEIHIEFLREIMKIRNISISHLAKECGTPESTLKKLLSGEVSDPRISTLYSPVKYLGASIDRLVGLAPPRDFHEEDRVYDATLMETMQQRATMLEEHLASKESAIADLRSQIHGFEVEVRTQEVRLESRANSIAHRDQIISELKNDLNKQRKISILCFVVILLLIGVLFLGIWEIINIDQGITALLHPDMLNK